MAPPRVRVLAIDSGCEVVACKGVRHTLVYIMGGAQLRCNSWTQDF